MTTSTCNYLNIQNMESWLNVGEALKTLSYVTDHTRREHMKLRLCKIYAKISDKGDYFSKVTSYGRDTDLCESARVSQ